MSEKKAGSVSAYNGRAWTSQRERESEREREGGPKSADCELIKSAEHKSRCQARVRPLIVQLTHLLHDSSPAFGQRVQYNTIEPQYQLYYGTSA